MIDFKFFRSAVADAAAQVRKLRANIAELQAEREAVARAPAHRSDLKTIYERWFEACTADFRTSFKAHLAQIGQHPERALETCRKDNIWNRSLAVVALVAPMQAPGPKTMDVALSALLAAPMKEALFRLIDDLAADGEGLPLDQRRAKLAQLDAQIEKLVKQERDLLADARAAGITID